MSDQIIELQLIRETRVILHIDNLARNQRVVCTTPDGVFHLGYALFKGKAGHGGTLREPHLFFEPLDPTAFLKKVSWDYHNLHASELKKQDVDLDHCTLEVDWRSVENLKLPNAILKGNVTITTSRGRIRDIGVWRIENIEKFEVITIA